MRRGLTSEHVELLERSAIRLSVAVDLGVYSAVEPDDVPDVEGITGFRNLPALVFPWRSPAGRIEYQLRPDNPTNDRRGRPRKYVFAKGMTPVLWEVRKPAEGAGILLVEGTKQVLAAATNAPDADLGIYGIAGCRMWQQDGSPITDLEVADGRPVTIILDADAAEKREVYDAGCSLAAALKDEGASSVKFVHLPGGGNLGLDDILAKRAPERRAKYLERLVANARTKPADTPPTKRKRAVEVDDDRPTVIVNGDRRTVIREIVEHLRAKWDGTELFNHGDVISRLRGHRLEVLDKHSFGDTLSETVLCLNETSQGLSPAWPEPYTVGVILSKAEKFTPLERVAQVPFFRPDGSVCQSPGYDEATRTVLVPAEEFTKLDVPEDPSEDEIAAARDLLLVEWFGDMPLPTDADRANLLALILTPLIRGLVPLAPLAVVDGLQMGVGKNLLADCLSILVTGQAANPLPYAVGDDAEARKALTSAFKTGAELFVFDEAHELEGASFARALTATTWSDRILGQSLMAEFPNRVTWASLGNNVQVRGDMTRRVYRIHLAPAGDAPQDRDNNSFRHPDLTGWTHENRPELLRAALILVRAWFVAGKPAPEGVISFGSFEQWQKTVGGILSVAGVPGFLDNLRQWRSETDATASYWLTHFIWLHEHFAGQEFTTTQVRDTALADPGDYEAPPGLEDPAPKSYTKDLGMAYARRAGRSHEGYRLVRVGTGHRRVARWSITYNGPSGEGEGENKPTSAFEVPPGPSGPSEGRDGRDVEGPPIPPRMRESLSMATSDTHVYRESTGEVPPRPSGPHIVFDLETADADDLFRYGPGFVRLGGVRIDGGPVRLTTKIDRLTGLLQDAGRICGHNILGFDLVALARYHGLDLHEFVDRGAVFDTLLAARQVDPPPARISRKDDLDSVGERLGLGKKSTALRSLKRKHGGYDRIPVDDPDYRDYLRRDVELSSDVELKLDTDDPYVLREHRVAAIAAQMSLNGFAVDVDLLAERVSEGDHKKALALAELHETYGVPLVDDKGEEQKSPLATKAGKAALVAAFDAAGVAYPKTGKSRDISTSGDSMAWVIAENGGNKGVCHLAHLIRTVTGVRSIYHTISDHLVDGRVHPRIGFDQSTGRWSVTKPGMTTLGKREGRVREREVFLPDPGHVIIALDLAQIDARAVAILSGDTAYAKLFEPGAEDLHTAVAKQVFGNAAMRETAKQISHGWNYGRGPKAIADAYDLEPRVCVQFDQGMRDRFPRLVQWRAEVEELAASGALLDNGFGRKMRPDPARAYTQGPAFMGQGFARDVACEGMLELPREVLVYLRTFVHDEIVLSVPRDDAEEVARIVEQAFSFPDRWPVPIVGECARTKTGELLTGSRWAEVYAK